MRNFMGQIDRARPDAALVVCLRRRYEEGGPTPSWRLTYSEPNRACWKDFENDNFRIRSPIARVWVESDHGRID